MSIYSRFERFVVESEKMENRAVNQLLTLEAIEKVRLELNGVRGSIEMVEVLGRLSSLYASLDATLLKKGCIEIIRGNSG